MITVDFGIKKIVLIVCYDKSAGKYRSVNIADRTIAPKMYDKPSDVTKDLAGLVKKGKIKSYHVTDKEDEQ